MAYGISNQCDGCGWVEAGETLDEAIAAGQQRYRLDDCDSFFVANTAPFTPAYYMPSADEVFGIFCEAIDTQIDGHDGRGGMPVMSDAASLELSDFMKSWARKHFSDHYRFETRGDIDEVDIVRDPK